MKNSVLLLSACMLLVISCGQSNQEKEMAFVTEFYERVLGNKPMEDDFLKASLTEDILNSIWEADYDDAYSYWVFRTGFQDGPEDVSKVESVEPIGEGWYRVSYSDMGNPGITDVKVENGKICDYKTPKKPYMIAIDNYMKGIGKEYAPAQYCIPFAVITLADESNPEETLVYGDFWVENFNQEGDTLMFVSGGSHPGLMHVAGDKVIGFDAAGDGASFIPSAKKIFGEHFDAFSALQSNDELRKEAREDAIAAFVQENGLQVSYYKDYVWPAVKIEK